MITHLLFLHLLILITTITSSSPSNFTLYGTAHINQTSITLTQPLSNCTLNPGPFPNTGRIFYKHPIQLPTSLSFSTRFTFSITPPPPPCLPGEGLAFLLTSGTRSLPYSLGSIGLPVKPSSPDSTFLAVEFDSSLDKSFGDINDNHVGIDLDSVVSSASVDLTSVGIDLKGGKTINAWIQYNSSQKAIQIWVGYSGIKPDSPILAAPVDLTKRFHRFHGFMYVGFAASNGRGSSVHMISNWEFKTFETESVSDSMYPNFEVDDFGSGDCLICFPEILPKESGFVSETDLPKIRQSDKTGLQLAIGLLVVNLILVVLTVCCVVMYLCLIKKDGSVSGPGQCQTGPEPTQIRTFHEPTNTMPRRFKYSEIRSATKGFNRNLVIGEGVSAVVYKTDRNLVIKRFKTASFGSQTVTEFATMLGSLQHKNLMKLKGWCCERSELILVYDHMVNGSLDRILRNRTITAENFTFEARLNVLIGVSSALLYLHEECDRLIVHRNVKSSNILLDFDLVPKLGDLGMSERDVTVPARAMGYLAPEYVYSRVPTVKTDVYSFGVVVLEVASGRAAVDDNGVAVADWVWDLWEEKRLVAAADGNLGGKFNRIEMEMVLMVGLMCVHPNYQMRPTMKEVVQMLKGEMLPELPEVKPTVMIQSVTSEGSPEVVVKCGGDEVLTSWGTPTSHFSKV